MSAAISIANLSKRYTVTHEAQRRGYRTLRESLVEMASAPLRRVRGQRSTTGEDFWALKDVSLEVQPGEVVGIIGRNGAGKSTLLKILSQITKPTTGRVTLTGRVGSLLEVGTGFHPELTGRENIYLNGSILGMRGSEIARKFDGIVEFSGIEKFLDLPVKRYSSGMYVRLAFAVAAHLEPEILIVDEVLAVGDQAFQERCLGKMNELTQSGRTVLFVSHNLQMLGRLCGTIVWLERGSVRATGAATPVLSQFNRASTSRARSAVVCLANREGRIQPALIQQAMLLDEQGCATDTIRLGTALTFVVDIANCRLTSETNAEFQVRDAYGNVLFTCSSSLHSFLDLSPFSTARVCCRIASISLIPGEYTLSVALGTRDDYLDKADGVIRFDIVASDIYRTGHVPDSRHGMIVASQSWTASAL